MTEEEKVLNKLIDNDIEPSEICYFVEPYYASAIIGITNDNRLVYDAELMAEDMARTDNITYEEAAEFIDYNCYTNGNQPIVMYKLPF